jgi:YD repeat-containing protein
VRRLLHIFIVLVIIVCSAEVTASAQSNPCLHWATGVQQPFPAGFSNSNCVYIMYSFGSYTCTYYSCPPAATPSETRGKCPFCSLPISLSAGNVDIEENDVRIPGLAGGLNLSRTWNSMWPPTQTAYQTGIFGLNWRSTYEERIFMGSDGYVRYLRGDGSFWSFGGSISLYPVAPANVTAALTLDNVLNQWTLAFQNGEKRIFSSTSGSLTSIIDRNGNTTQLSYDGLNRLVTVTDPGGRHLYFTYQNGSSYLVSAVTSDVGISLSYSYDSSGRLIQVTEPDLTTLSYQFDANSLITAVIDSNGKVLESHTYDYCARATSGARAGGVEAVALSYPYPTCPGSPTIPHNYE